jgi:hypothetical protein
VKYAILLYDSPENWAGVSEEEMGSLHADYMAVTNEPETYGGVQLQARETAKTLRLRGGELVITDGPFTETKEVISGLYLVDADSEERAIELATRIPTLSKMGGAIEIRPIVER